MSDIKTTIAEQLQQLQMLMHRASFQSFMGDRMQNPYRGQGRVLAILKMKPEISQKELGFLLNMSKQALAELLAKLEKSGYITREPSEEDKRVMTIKLTESGLNAAGDVGEGAPETAKIFDCLNDEELAAFSGYLARIIERYEDLFPGEDFKERFRMMEAFMHRYGRGFGDHHGRPGGFGGPGPGGFGGGPGGPDHHDGCCGGPGHHGHPERFDSPDHHDGCCGGPGHHGHPEGFDGPDHHDGCCGGPDHHGHPEGFDGPDHHDGCCGGPGHHGHSDGFEGPGRHGGHHGDCCGGPSHHGHSDGFEGPGRHGGHHGDCCGGRHGHPDGFDGPKRHGGFGDSLDRHGGFCAASTVAVAVAAATNNGGDFCGGCCRQATTNSHQAAIRENPKATLRHAP